MENIDDTPLHEKLGIKEGFEIKLINEPENFFISLDGIRTKVHFQKILKQPVDMIHLFTRSKKELLVEFPVLKNFIRTNGMLWVSWPKKSSSYVSDLNENFVREIGLVNGLVDTKICSIDESWSALKFVYRKEDRTK
ncbi:DUF3052 domain-containing protein [bacterium]|nr:DUF3052 domain-containing protein [bacterium]